MDPFAGWPAASAGARYRPGVHVWGATVAALLPQFPSFWDRLSEAERERAAAFRFDRHRDAYVVAHGVLHDVLSRYLEVDPAAIAFDLDASGRPSLAGGLGATLDFNLSHAGEALAVVVASGQSVGVDVEQVASGTDTSSLAERFFALEEIEQIRSAPAERAAAAFFDCWTKKEAIVKAIGRGLSIPLDSFAVEIGARRQRVAVAGEGAFTIVDLDLSDGYAGAVAMELDAELTWWTWTPAGVKAPR